MKIGIIGGGWMGLVLAYRLSQKNHHIHLLERDTQLGGLATYEDYGDFYWDRFYHVILPTDNQLVSFIEEIGLGDKLRWKETFTGVYVDENFYSVSNSKEFLLFPPLNIFQKFRLGMTILIGSQIKDAKKMEKITVEEWLIKYSGKTTYEKFWKPLLKAKLGDSYRRVSAVFIWTYIKRLFEARGDSSAKKEQMGYLEGGYKTALDHLFHTLPEKGVDIKLETTVTSINPNENGGITIKYNGDAEHFDKVIFTGPVNVLEKVAHPSLMNVSGNTGSVEYLGVLCMIIATKKPLTPYYVLNIADERIPFTGVIGMTTLVDTAQTGGYHLTYLPKYIISDDPILRKPDDEIVNWFLEGLNILYPDLKEEDIVFTKINRAIKVQPLQVINYSQIFPKVETQHPDFFVLNTSQFTNDTLNNNSVTQHVNEFVEQYGDKLEHVVNKELVP